MQSQDIWSIVSVLFGFGVLVYTYGARRRGRILGQLNFINKSEHPRAFTLYVVLYTGIGLASILIPPLCKFLIFK